MRSSSRSGLMSITASADASISGLTADVSREGLSEEPLLLDNAKMWEFVINFILTYRTALSRENEIPGAVLMGGARDTPLHLIRAWAGNGECARLRPPPFAFCWDACFWVHNRRMDRCGLCKIKKVKVKICTLRCNKSHDVSVNNVSNMKHTNCNWSQLLQNTM